MFGKLVVAALAIVATLWAMGYDAASIKRAALRWSNSNASSMTGGGGDWGPDA